MKTTRYPLLALACLVLVTILACRPEAKPERESAAPAEDYQTVPKNGGTIFKENIAIEFASGSFDADAKVAISNVQTGSVAESLEASAFYKITMPVSLNQEATVRIKCPEPNGDIRGILRSWGTSISYGGDVKVDTYLDAEYDDGEYIVKLPSFNNGPAEGQELNMTIGLAHIPDLETKSSTLVGGKVKNIQYEVDYSTATYLWLKATNQGKLNRLEQRKKIVGDYTKEAITKILDLGFTLPDCKINVFITPLDDAWGKFNQSELKDYLSRVEVNQNYLMEEFPNWDDLKCTLIHEIFHNFQSWGYDPRWAVFKGKAPTQGEEIAIYEIGAVWMEQFMMGGELNGAWLSKEVLASPVLYDYLGFADIANEWPTDKGTSLRSNIQNQGYSMAPLLKYITTYLKADYGIDNSFVVDLHKYWTTLFASTKYASTAYACLTNAVGNKDNCQFFYGRGVDDFALKFADGTLAKGFYLHIRNLEDVNDVTKLTILDKQRITQPKAALKFDAQCEPFGFSTRVVTLSLADSKALADKKLVIKQLTEDTHTYLLVSNKGSNFKKFTKANTTPITVQDSLVLDGAWLQNLGLSDGSVEHDFFLVSTRTDVTPTSKGRRPYSVRFELKDAVENNPDNDIKVTEITDGSFRLDGYIKTPWMENASWGSGAFNYYLCNPYYPTFPKFSISQSGSVLSYKADYTYEDNDKVVKGKYSFDLTGVTGKCANMKIANFSFLYEQTNKHDQITYMKRQCKLSSEIPLEWVEYEKNGTTDAKFALSEGKGLKIKDFVMQTNYGEDETPWQLVSDPDNSVEITLSFKSTAK